MMEPINRTGSPLAGSGRPLVSVCIPTYNGQAFLRKCLDSVLAQTFPDFEILVIDDQSRDDTMNILVEYKKRDRRIRVERNPRNLGLARNWNRCVEMARGDWIKFVFQDDIIAPTSLNEMIAAADSSAEMVVCRRDIIFDETTEYLRGSYLKYLDKISLENIFRGKDHIPSDEFCDAVIDHLGLNFIGEPTCTLLNRSLFYRFGMFNPHLIQICDLEFWIRVAVNVGLAYVPETLATFRVHQSATSVVNREDRKFRMRTLDNLILLHEFAFHPLYAPLRSAGSRRRVPVDFFYMLSDRVYDVLWDVKKNSGNRTDGNGIQEDWKNLTVHYPMLEKLPSTFLPKKWRGLKRRLNNLWRRREAIRNSPQQM
jgi:glycosyltransferase involved in cell wall biosynthesis